jgi:hypothetical protein
LRGISCGYGIKKGRKGRREEGKNGERKKENLSWHGGMLNE